MPMKLYFASKTSNLDHVQFMEANTTVSWVSANQENSEKYVPVR